jgi:Tfp pilus assembly protein PilX
VADLKPPRQPSRGASSEERLRYAQEWRAYEQEIQRRATEIRERPFREAERAQQEAEAARRGLESQLQEQAQIKAKAQAELAAAEREARIAGKRSAAVSTQLRSRSMLEQAQLQQTQAKTTQEIQKQQRVAGSTVGQPGKVRTKVSSGLGIGGYGGSRASRVSPTGLNI